MVSFFIHPQGMETIRAFLISSTIVIASAFLGVLFFASQTAHASSAGSLTIEQVSGAHQMGTWVLATPSGRTVTDSRGETSVDVDPIERGSHALTVQAPRLAYTTIVVYRGTEVIDSVDGTRLTFFISEEVSHQIVITYRFFGAVRVESDPPGQAFVLRGSDTVSFTGVTPAYFHSVPPLHYTASFEELDGCMTPRNQSRTLAPQEEIIFLGVYRCSFPRTDLSPPPPPLAKTPDTLLNLHLTANSNEVLPGSTIHYTLNAANEGRRSINNVVVSIQFDPFQGSVQGITDGGTMQGDSLIVWNVPKILAGKTFSTTFEMTVNDIVSAGDHIAMASRASAQGLVESGTLDGELTHTVGVALLPQTGMRADLLFAALLSASALLFALTIRPQRSVAITTVS